MSQSFFKKPNHGPLSALSGMGILASENEMSATEQQTKPNEWISEAMALAESWLMYARRNPPSDSRALLLRGELEKHLNDGVSYGICTHFCPACFEDIKHPIKERSVRAHLSAAPTVQEGTEGEVSDQRLALPSGEDIRRLAERFGSFGESDLGDGSYIFTADAGRIVDFARALLSSTPIQGARMLTDGEAESCMEWTLLASEVEAIQRKFASVNRIQLAPTGAEGGQHG